MQENVIPCAGIKSQAKPCKRVKILTLARPNNSSKRLQYEKG